jgi:hypothetical protein
MSGRVVGAMFSTVEASFAQVMHRSVHKTKARLVDNRVADVALDQLHLLQANLFSMGPTRLAISFYEEMFFYCFILKEKFYACC